MKKSFLPALLLITCLTTTQLLAQSVGINTTAPDPSAALDIKDPQRGVLLPRVVLKSKSDNTAIINPATSLLVYSYTAAPTMYAGPGFYYNEGTPASPSWRSLADLKLPYVATGTQDVMVDFQNYGNANSTTLHLSNVQGYALSTQGKIKIGLPNQTPGLGKVLTSDASGNATWEGGIAFRASGILGGTKQVQPGPNGIIAVPFGTQEYDLKSDYNDANAATYKHHFIAPVKGIYHFDAGVSWDYTVNGADRLVRISLIKLVGVSRTEVVGATCRQDQVSLALGTDVMLNANDKVFIEIFQGADQDVITLKSPSFFSGRMMIKQ